MKVKPLRLLATPGIGRLMSSLTPPSPKQARMVFDSMNERQALEDDPALEAATLATERLPSYDPAWRSLLHAVLTITGPRSEIAFGEDELRRVRQPVRFGWGVDDPFGAVEVGRRAADLIPDADLHFIEGGHLPWLDSPERAAELVEAFQPAGED